VARAVSVREAGAPAIPARVLAVAAAAVPLGIYGEWSFAHAGASPLMLLYDVCVGGAFVAAGLVASARTRSGRVGLLMVFEGASWF
jgi:hypothetical protein